MSGIDIANLSYKELQALALRYRVPGNIKVHAHFHYPPVEIRKSRFTSAWHLATIPIIVRRTGFTWVVDC